MSPAEKKSMIVRDQPDLSIVRQCEMLKLSRSAFYYTPVGIDEETLVIMTAIDQVFIKYPFFGSRQLRAHLRRDGIIVGFQDEGRLAIIGAEFRSHQGTVGSNVPAIIGGRGATRGVF